MAKAKNNSSLEDDIYSDIENLYISMEKDNDLERSLILLRDPPDQKITSINNELVKNIKKHFQELISKLATPIPAQIKNQQDAEEASEILQDINKMLTLISSVPSDLEHKEDAQAIIAPLQHDIEIISKAASQFCDQYKQRLQKYDQALQRVKKVHGLHDTRSTNSILKGVKDIPDRFFLTPKNDPSKQPRIPWQCSDEKREDENLEKTLLEFSKEQNIIKLISDYGIIPNANTLSLTDNIEKLNQMLIGHNIYLKIEDEELENKVKHSLNILYYQNQIINPKIDKCIDNTQDKSTVNHRQALPDQTVSSPFRQPIDQSTYLTPKSSTYIKTVKEYKDNNQVDDELEASKYFTTTTREDLVRFQQEASFPSVRSKNSNARVHLHENHFNKDIVSDLKNIRRKVGEQGATTNTPTNQIEHPDYCAYANQSMYFTPKPSTNINTIKENEENDQVDNEFETSKYFTPRSEFYHETPKRNETYIRHANVWPNRIITEDKIKIEENIDNTNKEDLRQFQQEASFPSVESKNYNARAYSHKNNFDKDIMSDLKDVKKKVNFVNEVQDHYWPNVRTEDTQRDSSEAIYRNSLPKNQHPKNTSLRNERNTRDIINKIRKLEVEMDNLDESNDSAERIINRLKNIEDFTFQELQDLSLKITEYNKQSKSHRKAHIEFKKEFIDIEELVKEYSEEIFEQMNNTSITASKKAKQLTKALKDAEDKIFEEKVTNANVSSLDSREIIYADFTGQNSERNIYETLKNHENNHRLNRTSNYLKGIILKKHLKGNAKLAIPDDMTNYDEIKTALIKRYGNVNELLAALYNQHCKIGPTMPRTGSVVQWAKINDACKAHLTLLRRADLLLKNATDTIINERYVTELIKFLCPEDRYEVLSIKANPTLAYAAIRNKFNTTLDMSLEMLRLHPRNNTTTKKRHNEQNIGTSEFGLIANYELSTSKECYICQLMQEQGNMQGFFENHLQNKNTGSFYNAQCPLYLQLPMKERFEFLRKNQICLFCVNPISNTHKIEICRQKNLTIKNGRQPPYTCRTIGCPNRLELCIVHKDSNMEALLKRKDTLGKNNIDMCLVTWNDTNSHYAETTIPQSVKDFSIEKVSDWLERTSFSSGNSCYDYLSSNCDNQNKIIDTERPLLVQHKETLLNQKDVTTTITNLAKPLFMFMKLKGHQRGINLVFDSGSSAVVCTDSIPGKELKACKQYNEAIELQGLGATKKHAQAWTILLPIPQKKFIATTAYSVPHILGPLSPICLAPAHQLLKEAAPKNEEVQRSKIYDYLSGNIEMLAGIRLNSLFPEKVFQMANGLALYRLKLTSHQQSKMYCLGGPYEIINEMQKIFIESANFLNEIDIGLEQWRAGNTAHINEISPQSDSTTDNIESTKKTTNEERYIRRKQIKNDKKEIDNTVSEKQLNNELSEEDLQEIDRFMDHIENEINNTPTTQNHADSDENIDLKTQNHANSGENADLTEKNLKEIDNYLDYLNNKSSPSNYQEAKNVTSNKVNHETVKIYIIAEINSNQIIQLTKDIQHKILLKQKIDQQIKPCKKLFINIMNIEMSSLKDAQKQLKECCKRIKIPKFNIYFKNKLMLNAGALEMIPDSASKLHLKRIQRGLQNTILSNITNVKVDIIPNLNVKIMTSNIEQCGDFMNESYVASMPNLLIKNIKMFKAAENNQEKFHQLLINIKLKSNMPKEVTYATLDVNYAKDRDSKAVTKDENETRTKDNTFLKNLEAIIDAPKIGYRCTECISCNRCRQNPNQGIMSMKEQLEQYLIEKSVSINRRDKHFIAKLPLINDPKDSLTPNRNETRIRLKKVLQKLCKNKTDADKIKTAFHKLLELGYVCKVTDLPQKLQETISTKTCYYIPWDYVSKPTSITTEKRQVYDASAKTSSGNSLNDILAKGCPKMDFDGVLYNFVSNTYAISGDLMKFYQSVKLHEDHYNLQLMLWEDSMDPNSEPTDYVITRLTFGLKSSSQQLEHCVDLLAEENKHKKPLYRILKHQRYVDDLMGSYNSKQEIEDLKKDLDSTLSNYGMKIKGYACSYEKPPDSISDGISLVTGGYIWHPELDILFIRIQPLHYGEKKRGQILTENIFMEGTLDELQRFVPKDLTLRQVLSRGAQVFDPLGLVGPWKTGVKILTRESLESVNKDWDATLSTELRERWIRKFWDMQELKRIGFKRCSLAPEQQIKSISLICFCDAGKHAKVQVIYLMYEINEFEYNIQMLCSKSQLVQSNKTLANMELDSINTGAEMLNKCYQALPKVDRTCLVGDSQITSYWIAKDTISLATFQRNRVSNIRRLINIQNIYRCKGTENVADIGTKGETSLGDSIPGSDFHNGPNWLKQGLDHAITIGHLVPIKGTTIDPNDTKMWNLAADGLVGKCKWPEELLTRNENKVKHPILLINYQWVNQVKERYLYSNYLFDPLKKSWTQVLRTVSITLYFIHKLITKIINNKIDQAKIARWSQIYKQIFDMTKECENNQFNQTFASMIITRNQTKNRSAEKSHTASQTCINSNKVAKALDQSISTIIKSLGEKKDKLSNATKRKGHILDLFGDGMTANLFKRHAIIYFLKKGSRELEAFYRKGMLKKHTIKVKNLLYSRNRWLEANQLRIIDEGNINLHDINIQELAPVLDRHSPIAISIAKHFHNHVTKHAGADRSHLAIQGSVFIFQGQKLFEDICRDCITCRIKLKQRFTQIMGPLGKEQITYSAVGRFMFLDMSGPYDTKSSALSKTTRRTNTTIKTWLLHGVCIVSNYSVVQVLETYATDSFVQAVHRIASYIGYPQLALIDSSQTEIKGLTKTKFSMYDASNRLYDECGITIKTCGVGPKSHARHGVIERRVGLFKKFFDISRKNIADLTPIGLYTLALQAASHLNASPLCTRKRNGSTISSRLITPNCFLLGKRNSHRAPADIPQIIEDRSQIMDNLFKAAEGMLSFFQVNIPDMLLRTCYTDTPREEIKKGDLVLFTKEESPLTYQWKMGIIYDLEMDDDNKPRIFQITYVNKEEIQLPLTKEDNTETNIIKRMTRKGANTIVKLHSINDEGLNNDLAYLNNILHDNADPNEPLEKISTVLFTPDITFLQNNIY